MSRAEVAFSRKYNSARDARAYGRGRGLLTPHGFQIHEAIPTVSRSVEGEKPGHRVPGEGYR